MRRRAFTLIEMIVAILILVMLAAILFPVFIRRNPQPRRSKCQSNLKQLGLGFAQYVQDAGEKYPPASVAWGAAVQPYIKTWQSYHCPSVSDKGIEQSTDYFFNARAFGVKWDKFNNMTLTILLGEGVGGQALDTTISQLPDAWRKDNVSPAKRHIEGSNYGFADGHVKWMKPEKVTLDKPSVNSPTFLIR